MDFVKGFLESKPPLLSLCKESLTNQQLGVAFIDGQEQGRYFIKNKALWLPSLSQQRKP